MIRISHLCTIKHNVRYNVHRKYNEMDEYIKSWIASLAREEKAEVLADIAKRCKVSPFTVQAWLRGKRNPSPLAKAAIQSYARKKGVSVC